MTAPNILGEAPIRAALIDKKSGLIDRAWAIWFRDIYRLIGFKGGNLLSNINDEMVSAGYGGLASVGLEALGTVNSTWKTVTGYDTQLISDPKNVEYEISDNAMVLKSKGVWEFTANVSLSFDPSISSRSLSLRIFNASTSTGGHEVKYYAPADQDGVSLPLSITYEVGSGELEDVIVLQIRSETGTFSNVVNGGSLFQAKHISEPGTES